MSRSPEATINPNLLLWARAVAQMKPSEAAKKLRISAEKLSSWEAGTSRPTIKQLRKLAKLYNQNFAAFFLPSPPQTNIPIPQDYRRQAGTTMPGISPAIALDVRTAWERRSIVLELYEDLGTTTPVFNARTSMDADPEYIGQHVRNLLHLSYKDQSSWRDTRVGFNKLREAVEAIGVLVFQSSDIPLESLRGYSLPSDIFPVIVVNRKDHPAARSFTLMHELVHLMLRTGGLCDLIGNDDAVPEELRIEVFCNLAAGAILVPKESLVQEQLVQSRGNSQLWTDDDIDDLVKIYSVSREVIVRRLSLSGFVSAGFYQQKRNQYQQERQRQPRIKGFVSPSVDTVSLSGKKYVRTVLDAYHSDRITASDVSDYLGVKLKHLDRIVSLVSAEAEGV